LISAQEIETFVGLGPDHQPATTIPYTPRARKALAIAAREAKALNHAHVGAEHVFLGLLIEGNGVAARVLERLGVRTEIAREAV
jgi:ATP-dependent Clp protease ATP-binding subunit ClpC